MDLVKPNQVKARICYNFVVKKKKSNILYVEKVQYVWQENQLY